MNAYDDDLPRRLHVVKVTGWTLHDYPCSHGCFFHDEALGQPCCQGLCCKRNDDTPQSRAARRLAQAVDKRIADRRVRISMTRTGRFVLQGLTDDESRIGSDNLAVYLSEHGSVATRAAFQRAQQLATRTSRTATARVIGR